MSCEQRDWHYTLPISPVQDSLQSGDLITISADLHTPPPTLLSLSHLSLVSIFSVLVHTNNKKVNISIRHYQKLNISDPQSEIMINKEEEEREEKKEATESKDCSTSRSPSPSPGSRRVSITL